MTQFKRCCITLALLAVVGLGGLGCTGESLVSALLKVANSQLSQLSPAEIMLLNQFILQQIKAQDPNFQGQPLTLDQAAAIANFLRTNNINTPQELEALINGIHGGAAPTGLAELAEAFAGLSGFDPANPNPQDIPALMQLTFAVP